MSRHIVALGGRVEPGGPMIRFLIGLTGKERPRGVTDSFGPELAPLRDGLGFLTGSFCPHYDAEAERRPAYERLLAEGFPAGIAADDGAGVHFVGTELAEAVTEPAEAHVYRVELGGGSLRDTPIAARVLPSA